jgi:hypothetical protein
MNLHSSPFTGSRREGEPSQGWRWAYRISHQRSLLCASCRLQTHQPHISSYSNERGGNGVFVYAVLLLGKHHVDAYIPAFRGLARTIFPAFYWAGGQSQYPCTVGKRCAAAQPSTNFLFRASNADGIRIMPRNISLHSPQRSQKPKKGQQPASLQKDTHTHHHHHHHHHKTLSHQLFHATTISHHITIPKPWPFSHS